MNRVEWISLKDDCLKLRKKCLKTTIGLLISYIFIIPLLVLFFLFDVLNNTALIITLGVLMSIFGLMLLIFWIIALSFIVKSFKWHKEIKEVTGVKTFVWCILNIFFFPITGFVLFGKYNKAINILKKKIKEDRIREKEGIPVSNIEKQ